MEKEKFLSLVQNFTSLSEDEASALTALQKDFPYSQLIHNLATRAAQDHQLKIYSQQLHLSAVYTTDRAVLKELMTKPKGVTARPVQPKVEHGVTQETVTRTKIDSYESPAISIAPVVYSGDELIHEIEFDLARLKELKENFELTLEAYDKVNSGEKKKSAKKQPESSSPDDGLIEEIKTTKKEVEPEGEKQKEQNVIIDQFIKTSPSIKRKTSASASEDFSESNSAYSDNIISETLVEILLKQGKKEKAIEVLRKLIWKFPQKKTIFAAQIEDLKK